MKVEKKVGKSSSVGEKAPMTTKTKWIILFSGFGILIIGLVIAIVVVAVNRGSGANDLLSKPVVEEGGMNDEELNATYGDFAQEINNKMSNVDEQYSGEDILNIYMQKIEEVTDKRLKAMIEQDYYTMMLAVYPGDEKREEIINGLIAADAILKTPRSALMVANGASWYNDTELAEKYTNMAYDRMGLTEEVKKTIQAENEETAG